MSGEDEVGVGEVDNLHLWSKVVESGVTIRVDISGGSLCGHVAVISSYSLRNKKDKGEPCSLYMYSFDHFLKRRLFL